MILEIIYRQFLDQFYRRILHNTWILITTKESHFIPKHELSYGKLIQI